MHENHTIIAWIGLGLMALALLLAFAHHGPRRAGCVVRRGVCHVTVDAVAAAMTPYCAQWHQRPAVRVERDGNVYADCR